MLVERRKRYFALLVLIAATLTNPAPSNSTGIDIKSQSCSYNTGYRDGTGWSGSSPTGVFEPHGDGWATADVVESTAVLSAAINQRGVTDAGGATASAEIVFQPLDASNMNISAAGYRMPPPLYSVELFDQTASSMVLLLDPGGLFVNGQLITHGPLDSYHFQNMIIQIDDSHIYALSAQAFGAVDAGDIANSSVSMSLSVPEPTTMLLLACGLIGVLGLSRKFKE